MKKETLCVQSGYNPKSGDPRVTPIVQSTTYYYEKAQDLADLFDLKSPGHIYSRLSNPTNQVLEEKVAALEGGTNAIACASGQSATLMSILNVCSSGDNIISSSCIYGGTYNLFSVTLKKFGIETRFIEPTASIEEIEKLIDDNTKLVFAETIANPALVVLDFDLYKSICQKYGLLFFVDNTLATPYLCNPKEFGANIVIHSSSKYLDGHAVALGGIVVDLGNFNYKASKRYPMFNIKDESYHGIVYSNQNDIAFGLKLRAQMVRDLGAIMSPMNAFLTQLGIETLALRMQRHIENAKYVAEFLNNHPKIEWVKHPSLKSDPYYELAQKYMPNGVTGMMSFTVKGGKDKALQFMENLKIAKIVTHVADTRTCVLHPATTTHRQLSDDSLLKAGITPNLIRLSVGIENINDIIDDLKNALEAI